jgi:tetratricopeptide (TPR) repeat protein
MKPKNKKGKKRPPPVPLLLHDAVSKLEAGQAAQAAAVAKRALDITGEGGEFALSALNLLGQIHVELGEIEEAATYFTKAVGLDEDGSADERIGGGAEKFLWLAQLSEEGGEDSVKWFERGSTVLRKQIQSLDSLKSPTPEQTASMEEKKRKLGGALCAVAEVYMTDLSWEGNAEQICEKLITEAILVAPEMAETWQTVANVRISQHRGDDAKAALKRSLALWRNLPPEHTEVPDFPTRVSLARLLLEVAMEKEGTEVLNRLVAEDDESVEVLYLGGWAQYLVGERCKGEATQTASERDAAWKKAWTSSRRWLNKCMRQYKIQEYEDERLGEHANELLASINKELGEPAEDEDDEEDDWEDAEDSDGTDDDEDDEEMEG